MTIHQMDNPHRHEENGKEGFSGNESMKMTIDESEEKVDLQQSHKKVGDEGFNGDESMHAVVINKEKGKAIVNEFIDAIVEKKCEGWKYVKVAGSFDVPTAEGGGGFILRDCEGKALLGRSFPAPGNNLLSVEAYAVCKTMEEIINLGEEGVVFCLDKKFFDIIQEELSPSNSILSTVKNNISWCAHHPAFHVLLLETVQLESALWLSECGRLSRQHCQWEF